MTEAGRKSRLRLGQCCFRSLAWEYESSGDVNALVTALLSAGYCDYSRFPALRELSSPAGHVVVVVPKTGRVQLRLNYLTPIPDRRKTAQRLARELDQLCFVPTAIKPSLVTAKGPSP